MWKPSQPTPVVPPSAPEPSHPAPSAPAFEPPPRPTASAGDQATLGKGLLVKGEITGTESLYIDGRLEGSITLPGNRVTVGRNGQVQATITAREVVILGKVRGNIAATDRVEIRVEGSLTGDVTAARISIEDGSYFKGGIELRKTEGKGNASGTAVATEPHKPAQV